MGCHDAAVIGSKGREKGGVVPLVVVGSCSCCVLNNKAKDGRGKTLV